MASLSEKLRRERELRGISLKQISQETKIGVRFLKALEEGMLERIPGEFYRRSYIRAYARCLGLDEERALNAYAYSNVRKPEPAHDRVEKSERKPSTRVKWTLGAAALVLPALLLLRTEPPTVAEESPNGASEPAIAQPAPVEPNASAAEPLPADRSSRESSPSGVERASAEGLRVVLTIDDACWLQIVADGNVLVSGLKEEGFRSEFTANDEVRLWLGNAGGVRLWLNDEPAKPLGQRNQVLKDLRITRSNYRQFVELS